MLFTSAHLLEKRGILLFAGSRFEAPRVSQCGDRRCEIRDSLGDARFVCHQFHQIERPHEHGQRHGERDVSIRDWASKHVKRKQGNNRVVCFQVADQRLPVGRPLVHRQLRPQKYVHWRRFRRIRSGRQGRYRRRHHRIEQDRHLQ